MIEDDDLADWLSRRYAGNCREINWNDDGYRAWAERQHDENDVVYLVWLDRTKPHEVDHIILKDKPPMVGLVKKEVIPCESIVKAKRLKDMLLAP